MSALRPISANRYVYDCIVGTGGIGTGIFFELQGNDTLGREESRMAKLLPYKDYCKQHIILHYISVLLGAGKNGFSTYAIGKVGDDEAGKDLLKQMEQSGIDTAHVQVNHSRPTLFSVCYLYPDHSGGNITTSESASGEVTPSDIDDFFATFADTGKELVLAVPEVPVETRIRMLEHGRRRNSVTIASVASGEIGEFEKLSGFDLTSILFINLDEAKHIVKPVEDTTVETLVINAIGRIISINASITVFITCGSAGVYCYADKRLEFFPAIPVEVVSTAGAGDAFLAGTIAGMCCGLPLLKIKDEGVLTATEIGILVAAAAVTSPHTIHPGIDADFLGRFASQLDLPQNFKNIF